MMTTLEIADTLAGGMYALQLLFAPKMFLDQQLVSGTGSSGEIMCAYCGIMILARCFVTTLITDAQRPAYHKLIACQWGACLAPSLLHFGSFLTPIHYVNIALQVTFAVLFMSSSMTKTKST